MPDSIPKEVRVSALHAYLCAYTAGADHEGRVDEVLNAAAPAIAAQARREIAERIAREIEATPPQRWTYPEVRTWAANLARKIGDGHA